MNERIKEMCEQAKAYANECTEHFTGDEPVVWTDYYTEMFAELIVKECIKVMMENDYHGEWLGEKVKQHFEVT